VPVVLTLYYHPAEASSLCVRLVLVEKQLPFRRRMLAADEVPADVAGDVVGEWGRLPVLVDDTFSIADPMVIASYLEDSYPRPSLFPSGARGRAQVRMGMLRIDADLLVPVERWAAQREAPLTDLEDEVREALAAWNSRLGDSGLLFGTEMSLADIWLVAAVEKAAIVGAHPPPELGNLARWRARMQERASVRTERFDLG
jgi:glutathione S-transferase